MEDSTWQTDTITRLVKVLSEAWNAYDPEQMWRMHGTHRGRLMNIPASNRPIEIRGMSLLMVEDKKMARETSIWDVAGFLRSIGLLPEL